MHFSFFIWCYSSYRCEDRQGLFSVSYINRFSASSLAAGLNFCQFSCKLVFLSRTYRINVGKNALIEIHVRKSTLEVLFSFANSYIDFVLMFFIVCLLGKELRSVGL